MRRVPGVAITCCVLLSARIAAAPHPKSAAPRYTIQVGGPPCGQRACSAPAPAAGTAQAGISSYRHILSSNWSPSGRWIAFVCDQSGGEVGSEPVRCAVYVQSVAKGQPPRRLSLSSRFPVVLWHPKQDILAVVPGEADGQSASLWLATPETGVAKRLAGLGTSPTSPPIWDPTGGSIALVRRGSGPKQQSELLVISVRSGQVQHIDVPPGAGIPENALLGWSRRGRRIVCGVSSDPTAGRQTYTDLLAYDRVSRRWSFLQVDRPLGTARWAAVPKRDRGPRWDASVAAPAASQSILPDGFGRGFLAYLSVAYTPGADAGAIWLPYRVELDSGRLEEAGEIGKVSVRGQTGRWSYSPDRKYVAWLRFGSEGLSEGTYATGALWVAPVARRTVFKKIREIGELAVGPAPAWDPAHRRVVVIQRGMREDRIVIVGSNPARVAVGLPRM